MVGETGQIGRCAAEPLPRSVVGSEVAEAVVGPAEVVGGADQPHAGGEGRLGASDGPAPSCERREMSTEGGVEPLDVGGVDDGAGGRGSQDRLDAGQGAVPDLRVTPMTCRLAECLTTWANWNPSGRTRRGRPRRPVRSAGETSSRRR